MYEGDQPLADDYDFTLENGNEIVEVIIVNNQGGNKLHL
jgi:hypothetical protein